MAQPKILKNDFLKKKGSFWMLCWGQTTQWVWVEAGRPGWRQLSRWEMTLAKTTVVVPWIYSRKRQQDFFQWIRFEYVRERLTSQVVLVAKNLPTNAGDTRDWGSIPGSGRFHSNILAWRIPWTEEPGRLQSRGSQRVRHNWNVLACTHAYLSTEY